MIDRGIMIAAVLLALSCHDREPSEKPSARASFAAPTAPHVETRRERVERRLALDPRHPDSLSPGYRTALDDVPAACAVLLAHGCETDASACEERFLGYIDNGEILSHPTPHIAQATSLTDLRQASEPCPKGLE